jgi:hypothetical protein
LLTWILFLSFQSMTPRLLPPILSLMPLKYL